MQTDLKNIVESLLFVSDNPIDIRSLKQIIADADAKDIRLVIAELMAEYEERQGGFLLCEVAGGFQFRTRSEYKDWIKKLVKPTPVRLSKAALETLAIIAYHQPIIRSDVERIRGVDSGAIVRGLLERKLIRILGKKEIPGRPLIYATTRRFLEIFNLKNLSDMPSLKEIQEFGKMEGVVELPDEPAEQTAPEEGEATPGPETDMEPSGGDDPVFTEQVSETAAAEDFVSPEPDGDISKDNADSGVQDEDMNAPGAEELAEAEETDMPEPDMMGSPEYDDTGSPEQEEEMPEQESDSFETGAAVISNQDMDTPEVDGTEEEPPPENEENE
jgi:segregation and condensation protein B